MQFTEQQTTTYVALLHVFMKKKEMFIQSTKNAPSDQNGKTNTFKNIYFIVLYRDLQFLGVSFVSNCKDMFLSSGFCNESFN